MTKITQRKYFQDANDEVIYLIYHLECGPSEQKMKIARERAVKILAFFTFGAALVAVGFLMCLLVIVAYHLL